MSGDGMDLARRWHAMSDHAADGTPFGGGLCNCEKQAERVLRLFDLGALVEAVAERLSWDEGEMTRWVATAHPDHNRWSWRGDGHGSAIRDEYRERAAAVVGIVLEGLSEAFPGDLAASDAPGDLCRACLWVQAGRRLNETEGRWVLVQACEEHA